MADYIYLHPDYSESLRQQELVDIRRLLAWDSGKCVGEHGPRMVWKTTLSLNGKQEIAYIRQEKKIPLKEIVSSLIRFKTPFSRAVKNLQAYEILSKNRIDTPEIICAIERRFLNIPIKAAAVQLHAKGKDLYQELVLLGRPFRQRTNSPARIKLFYELGKFLAKINQGRINWPDLVAKHIFVEYADYKNRESPWWKFRLIDIDRLEGNGTHTTKNRQINRFLLSLRSLTTRTDIMRMSRGYLGITKTHPMSVRRNLYRKFFPDGWDWIKRAADERRHLQSYPENHPLYEEELYEQIGNSVVNMRFTEVLRGQGLLEKDAMFRFHSGSKLVKKGIGRRQRIRFEAVTDHHNIWLYLKRVRHPRLKDQMQRIMSGTLRHSGCWHERYMIKQLALCRIPVPRIVAYTEKMFLGYEIKSALITEGIVGQSLERFVPKIFSRIPRQGELLARREWTKQLAILIKRFHGCGFCHRDLYLSHIFISFNKTGKPVYYLIDLARCFKMNLRKKRWIVKELAGLNYSSPRPEISNTDRMRFFKTYLEKTHLDDNDKNLLKKIARKTKKIESHTRKHNLHTQERKLS